MSKTSTNDKKLEIFNLIVQEINNGTMPWKIPWLVKDDKNYITKKSYRGYNKLALGYARKKFGFESNEWITFNQAKNIAGNDIIIMEKGTKSTSCFYYSTYETKQGERKSTFKTFFLFNISQLTKEFQELLTIEKEKQNITLDVIDSDVKSFASETNLQIYDGDMAYYIPSKHEVYIPKISLFNSTNDYYSTLFHELIHSTSKYLERDIASFHKSKEEYSFEELIAEFGSAILCSQYNIDISNVQSSSYIEHWKKQGLFEQTKLFEAFNAAEKAVDYYNSFIVNDDEIEIEIEKEIQN